MKLIFYFKLLLIFICSLFLVLISFRVIYKNIRKLTPSSASTDNIFSQNTWNNYMIGLILTKKNDQEDCSKKHYQEMLKRFEQWDNKQLWYQKYRIKGIIETCTDSDHQSYVNSLSEQTPPKVDNKLLPYKLVLFPKQESLVFLLNHYYCDGKILHDFIVLILLNNPKSSVNFFKYKYYPIFSDVLLVNYLLKSAKRNFLYTRDSLSVDSKSLVVSKKVEHTYFPKLNRWNVLGHVLELLFEYLSVSQLSIAFTVGIDDTCEFGNNRIGCIILDIKKMTGSSDYSSYLKDKLISNKYDAIVSYDLLRNFPTQRLREMFNTKVDLVLTSFKIDSCPNMDIFSYEVGSIVGIGKLPLYVISMTIDKTVNICIKSSTGQFDYRRFLRNESNSKLNFYWGYSKEDLNEFIPKIEVSQSNDSEDISSDEDNNNLNENHSEIIKTPDNMVENINQLSDLIKKEIHECKEHSEEKVMVSSSF